MTAFDADIIQGDPVLSPCSLTKAHTGRKICKSRRVTKILWCCKARSYASSLVLSSRGRKLGDLHWLHTCRHRLHCGLHKLTAWPIVWPEAPRIRSALTCDRRGFRCVEFDLSWRISSFAETRICSTRIWSCHRRSNERHI